MEGIAIDIGSSGLDKRMSTHGNSIIFDMMLSWVWVTQIFRANTPGSRSGKIPFLIKNNGPGEWIHFTPPVFVLGLCLDKGGTQQCGTEVFTEEYHDLRHRSNSCSLDGNPRDGGRNFDRCGRRWLPRLVLRTTRINIHLCRRDRAWTPCCTMRIQNQVQR